MKRVYTLRKVNKQGKRPGNDFITKIEIESSATFESVNKTIQKKLKLDNDSSYSVYYIENKHDKVLLDDNDDWNIFKDTMNTDINVIVDLKRKKVMNTTTTTTTQNVGIRLQNNIIRHILEYIHHHFRFILTRYGLGSHTDHRPDRLLVHAILSARLMSEYKEVLLSQSFREKIWPVVESISQYNDIVPWLLANRCPYMYSAETVKTASVYGIYRSGGGEVYDGDWLNGTANGQGKLVLPDGEIYEGECRDDERNGQGKNVYADGKIYEGGWRDDKRDGQGKNIYADGEIYEGEWRDDERNGQGKMMVQSMSVTGKIINFMVRVS